ncbi:MAG: hypothetical protein RSB57_08700 [Hungatella sp.]
MLQFLETGKALYVLTAVCLCGILSRFVARNLYQRLIKETDNMTLTKNRYLREFKQKTENTYRLTQGIHNTNAYLEKQLYGYRFAGISLEGWGNLSGQLTILCLLTGGGAAFMSYWYRCDSYYIVLYGSVGMLTGLLTMLVDYGVNLSEKKQQLLAALQDYLENSLFVRLSKETPMVREAEEEKEAVRAKNREGIRSIGRVEQTEKEEEPAIQTARRVGRNSRKEALAAAAEAAPAEVKSRRDIDYLKHSLEQIAVSREKNREGSDWIKKLSPDELQLVNEILKEYLA